MIENYPRWRTESLLQALDNRRVIIISGARQSGKTTLTEQIRKPGFEYRTLDDTNLLDLALNDPKGFVKTSSETLIIDEIQKAPKLIPEIKMVVDKDNRNGQFILTGSVNLQTMPGVRESLAGRVKNIRLRPLTMGEIFKRKPRFLESAFAGNFPEYLYGYDKRAIFELAFRGGYPEAIRIKNTNEVREWHRDYLKTLIEYDLVDFANIRRKDALEELLPVLAAWSSKFMDINAISSSFSLSKPTIDSYINLILSLYIFDKVSPWLKTDYERVRRKSKLFAGDSGLMTSILNWQIDEVMLNVDRSGKLMETFVYQELAAQVDLETRYSLYQYRDREKREIDFVIERDDGAILGIEIKAGHNVSRGDFAAQQWFRDSFIKEKRPYTGIVLYSGDRTISYSDNFFTVPISALWME